MEEVFVGQILLSTLSGETEAAKWGAGGGWWGGGAQEFRSWQEESKEWKW